MERFEATRIGQAQHHPDRPAVRDRQGGQLARAADLCDARADPLLTDCRPATTGFQPSPPYWNGPTSGPPGLLLSRRSQVALTGS